MPFAVRKYPRAVNPTVEEFTMTNFTKELALSLVNSDEDFPIDFEEAWQWLGFSTKASAKRKLNHFKEGIDFSTSWLKTPEGGRPSEFIRLTVDCFKALGMMAGTDKGIEIRQYFIQCERELKKIKSNSISSQSISSQPTPRDIADFVSTILSIAGLDQKIIAASAANHVAKYYPALRPAAEELKKELVVETSERLLTPTEIGLILEQRTGIKYSGRRVNQLLAEKGLQAPNPNGKDPSWLPTPKGSEFSKLLLAAQKGMKDATRQHLQWFESVVSLLEKA